MYAQYEEVNKLSQGFAKRLCIEMHFCTSVEKAKFSDRIISEFL